MTHERCDRCEELEETVRQLRAALYGKPDVTCGQWLGLSALESRLVAALVAQAGRVVSQESIFDAMYAGRPAGREIKIVQVILCKARVKLRPHKIEIETWRDRGYSISKAMAARLAQINQPAPPASMERAA